MEPCFDLLKEMAGTGKSIEGDAGWLFLVNDTNNQLAQQFGLWCWDETAIESANAVLEERSKTIPRYSKFIVPEKSVAYREYLPAAIRYWKDFPNRPSLLLNSASYLLQCLEDAKPFGNLYFRADTHPNWIGSYFLYKAIISSLCLRPRPFHEFLPSMAGYDGDLFGWLTADEKNEYLRRNDRSKYTVDTTLKLDLETSGAFSVGHDYTKFSRPTLVYENIDKDLPRAVVFRDSTSQFMAPWIAEHFSRSVFVWDQGNVVSEVIERERPDFVIQIMAERFIWNYPSRIALI